MCGILALLLADKADQVQQLLFDGLTVLQHRGQDAAGMATCEQGRISLHKDNGLVKDVFLEAQMLRLRGSMGIGHCRYPTAGTSSCHEAQPFYNNYPFGICCAHNGNLTNVAELRKAVKQLRYHANTESDSELLLHAFASELAKNASEELKDRSGGLSAENCFKAVKSLMRLAKGGYSVTLMINGGGIVAFRDPHGIRPLVIGTRKSQTTNSGTLDYIAASESVALDTLGFDLLRDLDPGEAIFINEETNTMVAQQCYYGEGETPALTPCLFEYVYFARPDSKMDGVGVYESRVIMGRLLAQKIQRNRDDWEDIDVVIPVPDTSRTTAIETAYSLGRPLREAFQKNRYIARTFIMPGQQNRKKTVRLKLNTIKSEFAGRNVLLVDDSIVRGTTCSEIIQMARDAGAKKVFFVSAAPAVRFPNVYGIDLPTREELIATGRNEAQIAALIGADWMVYQDLEDLVSSVKSLNPKRLDKGFDASVFDGKYVTGDIDEVYFRNEQRAQSEEVERSKRARASCSVAVGISQSVSEFDDEVLDHLYTKRHQVELGD
eukprot:TRINITY_DN16368_c0_g5_i1.p1 TRINITY_DN16368_c0_g5~~TRINITY_DN16368_c0_g5_i1.p1  ORF type:complete len:549 (-),score=72.64 TRINITY_DN16368_c0_g5_i1:132-1778(-)